jgi:hypothetical protein
MQADTEICACNHRWVAVGVNPDLLNVNLFVNSISLPKNLVKVLFQRALSCDEHLDFVLSGFINLIESFHQNHKVFVGCVAGARYQNSLVLNSNIQFLKNFLPLLAVYRFEFCSRSVVQDMCFSHSDLTKQIFSKSFANTEMYVGILAKESFIFSSDLNKSLICTIYLHNCKPIVMPVDNESGPRKHTNYHGHKK